jgi:hypothetical protein
MAKKSSSAKQKAARDHIKRISALATKIQAKGGSKIVAKRIFKMNRNEAVKQAARAIRNA